MDIFKCPKCGRFYDKEIICPYCLDVICRDASSKSLIDQQAQRNKELEDENTRSMSLLQAALPHIECKNNSQSGLITEIGEYLQAKGGE